MKPPPPKKQENTKAQKSKIKEKKMIQPDL